MSQILSVDLIHIGGISQGIAVSGNPAKPALLILHGGGLPLPGVASKNDYSVLSENFLVVYWDQRGAGRSAQGGLNVNNMKIDNFLADVQEISEYIKMEYDKEKLYLLGHSWGSMLGMRSVLEHPENYYAYVGVSQQLKVTSSDELVYRDLRTIAMSQNNKSLSRKLEKLGPPPYQLDDWMLLRALVARSNGLVSGEGEIGLFGMLRKMFGSYLGNRDYGLFEVFRVQRNMNTVLSYIYNDMLAYDMTKVSSLEVPVLLFQGKHDLNSHPDISRMWFDGLDSSDKTWISFDDSAHMPMWEEPEKFQLELVRLLQFD
ncbi:MAG: pimeloyl-ACP methyl ester carboxylesterase [Limisphaerales bacterium]|jgi:pimeloyl-ACP methyl ester carboxylesterase